MDEMLAQFGEFEDAPVGLTPAEQLAFEQAQFMRQLMTLRKLMDSGNLKLRQPSVMKAMCGLELNLVTYLVESGVPAAMLDRSGERLQ